MMTSPHDACTFLLALAGIDSTLRERVTIVGQDPVFPTNILLGTAGAAAIAAAGAAAAECWFLRSGHSQQIAMDVVAAAASLRSDRYLRVNEGPPPPAWRSISGFYQTRDKRWIQLHCNVPQHTAGALSVLGCAEDKLEVARAVAAWDGPALEDAIEAAGSCAGLVRTTQEWKSSLQGQAVSALPLFEIVKIGESPPELLSSGDRPLSGIRVLDLTRVIAGPTGGRTLAEHGADVLRIRAAHLPDSEHLVMDTGHGKLAACLDLRQREDVEQLRDLIRQADVFSQSYRPGSLAARGFSPEELAILRPGIVCSGLSAFGRAGPWRDRRGYDTIVQSVSGFVDEISKGDRPRHLPAQALDYVTGYLLAFATMTALARRAREGGSYLVSVSLAQTQHWIDALGRLPESAGTATLKDPGLDDVSRYLIESETPFGRLRHVGPTVHLSETPARWARPSSPFGHDAPVWPA